ncbi:Na+/H+ antiporter subunit E [Nocardioides alkalitolerans]|uniref:Na+/H+ antiporter subunit E n=1 Tax=Nocardioides alkalitolerans TaxID=281714 RepID=UPI00041568D5|nr:Na+/H+ antiporter subunit E [Nocardioides alkalitolerans]
MSPQMKTTRSGRQRPARYRSIQWPMILVLTLVWWILWGSYSALSLVGGVLVAVGVCFVFPLPPLKMRLQFNAWAAVVLLGRFVFDVFRASAQVAWLTLFPPKPLMNALVEVRLRSRSDFVLTVVAELVSLVPGSVVVEAHRSSHTLFLHSIDIRDQEGIDRVRANVLAQEDRVVRAFGGLEEDETP